ncbi:uncharacterized protein HKW66_Vig0068930 [Vigna angularis]|uniref:Secreted protein n=1 Tax=Phaseolus angularis TaxID=3914 RepID=A0A8T0K7V4_PHAAN|nr:uncharacterized protein HKW66_Vig0068930 [Vigna angularis]
MPSFLLPLVPSCLCFSFVFDFSQISGAFWRPVRWVLVLVAGEQLLKCQWSQTSAVGSAESRETAYRYAEVSQAAHTNRTSMCISCRRISNSV